MADLPPVLKPTPRRAFEIMPASADSSSPPSPPPESISPDTATMSRAESSPSRTRSILNLTSSTLLGIYSNTGHDGSREESSTPWGTGAQTPSYQRSIDERRSSESTFGWDQKTQRPQARHRRPKLTTPQTMFRVVLLFAFGVAYGTIITQLHRSQKMSSLRLPGVEGNLSYQLIAWGISGVLLGSMLPWVDRKWEAMSMDDTSLHDSSGSSRAVRSRSRSGDGIDREADGTADWYAAVRSIGAFVGIAFAVAS